MNVSEVMPNGNVRIIVPINFKKTRTGSVITKAESMKALQNQIPLIAAIANGIQWQQWIDEGMFKNVTKLAALVKCFACSFPGKERVMVFTQKQGYRALCCPSPVFVSFSHLSDSTAKYTVKRNTHHLNRRQPKEQNKQGLYINKYNSALSWNFL